MRRISRGRRCRPVGMGISSPDDKGLRSMVTGSAKVCGGTRQLRRSWPGSGATRLTYCCACLVVKLKLPETQIRDGVQALALLPEFRVMNRLCAACWRQDDMLQMGA
jgi:hypothetical protein